MNSFGYWKKDDFSFSFQISVSRKFWSAKSSWSELIFFYFPIDPLSKQNFDPWIREVEQVNSENRQLRNDNEQLQHENQQLKSQNESLQESLETTQTELQETKKIARDYEYKVRSLRSDETHRTLQEKLTIFFSKIVLDY